MIELIWNVTGAVTAFVTVASICFIAIWATVKYNQRYK